jgi:hypothetical protein
MFGTPTVHWQLEIDSLDTLAALNQKVLQDKTYTAMLEKVADYWLEGSLRDEIVKYG